MKTLWSALSFLAIAHLLAIIMFVLWLWQSGRLSAERIETARAIFAPTVEQTRRAAEREAAEAEARMMEELEEARRTDPPVSSEVRLQQINRMEDIERRAMRRLADERAMLVGQLEEALKRIDQREAALEAERRSWEESVEAQRARRSSEQFAKTVRQYESVPPRQAKNMMFELINSGPDGKQQAVAYLDAMNARAASRILSEFRTEAEIQLATELLEKLRVLGVRHGAPASRRVQNSANADRNLADAR